MPKEPKITEETLTKHAQERFSRSQTFRQEHINRRWMDSSDLYDGKFRVNERQKSDTLLGQGRLFIPKTYSHLQRILVDCLDTYFFDKEETVNIVPWKNVPAATRIAVKTLLNYRLNSHPIEFYHESYEACQSALRNKVGIFKVYPRLTKKRVTLDDLKALLDRKGVPWNDNPVFKQYTRKITGRSELDDLDSKQVRKLYDDIKEKFGESTEYDIYEPQIDCLPYEDVFFDTNATWKDYYKHTIIHRFNRSYDYLKQNGYKNLDRIKDFNYSSDTSDEIKMHRSLDQGSPFGGYESFTADMQNIRCFEIWTHLDVDNDGYLESCSYIMAGDDQGPKIVIRDVEKNELPYKFSEFDEPRPPIIVGQAYPEAFKMYGKDFPEITEGLQRETNAQRNQEREVVALALRSHTLVQRGANVDLVSLVNRKIAGVTMSDDVSETAIRQMQTSVQGLPDLARSQARTDNDWFETTSLPPNMLGFSRPGEQTATETANNMQNANKKIAQIIRNLGYTLFLPAFKMLLRLEQTYETDDFIDLVTGRQLGWVLRSDQHPPRSFIQGEFELTVDFGVNKQSQIQRLMMLMERANLVNQSTMQMVSLGVVNPQQAKFIDTNLIFKRLMPLLGEKNAEEFDIAAQAPPPGVNGNGSGVASQTAIQGDLGFGNTPALQLGGMGVG